MKSDWTKITSNEEERLIKLYKKGKKKYYFNCIIITTYGSIIIFYLGIHLMDINLLHLSGNDIFYLSLFILMQLFIIKNIFIPVLGNWQDIESKYQKIVESKNQKEKK